MQTLRLASGIVGRMAGWGLLVDAGLGVIYFLLAELIVQVVFRLYRFLDGAATTDTLVSVGMARDAGGLVQLLFLMGVEGLLGGALAGILGGIVAGLVLAFGALTGTLESQDARRYPQVGRLTGAIVGTFPALLLLTIIQPPLVFNHLDGAWPVLGWVLFVVIPLSLVFGAAWWASGRMIAWLEHQPGGLKPSYQ